MADNDRDTAGYGLLDRGLLGLGDRIGMLAGVVLAVSSFTGWYTGKGEGTTISVTGWNTGIPGKLIFFVGVAAVVLVALRELGVEPPAALPESLLVMGLGAIGTILVMVRVLSIPDDFFFATRGVGIWIALAASIGVIVAGVLQASEEL
jgi:peptidoglycan/LPS O-acetylase OafA/YrhL